MSLDRARALRRQQGDADQEVEDDEEAVSDHEIMSETSRGLLRAYGGGVAGRGRDAAVENGLAAPTMDLPHRADVEREVGRPLDGVRAHGGREAARAADALGAQAFTYGDDIVFGQDAPSRQVVAHEVTHVMQQRAGRSSSESTDEAEARDAERSSPKREPMHRPQDTRKQLRCKPHDLADTDLEADAAADTADPSALLSPSKIKSAIKFNNKHWHGDHRVEILNYLRKGAKGDAEFGESDVKEIATLQLGAGVAAKQIDGQLSDHTMAILLNAGLALGTPDKLVNKKDVHLEFFPGELEDIDAWKAAKKAASDPADQYDSIWPQPDGLGKLYVRYKGQIVAVLDVRGGPPVKLTAGKGHTADPSKAGDYKLGKGEPHRTDAWYMSQIKWGAQVRERADKQIEFLDPAGKDWVIATGPDSALKQPMSTDDFLVDPHDPSQGYVTEWKQNDFGPMSWHIGKTDMYIHTTPEDEEDAVQGNGENLVCSHACLHVVPSQRDEMQKAGYFQQGVRITIKKYSEHMLPKAMREEMMK